ncbi:MAG: phosphate ABC transporter ATP-binding protein [Candidatus Dadabacteria bacterium]|nr:MAG: phosphate ABC transporter ATP-binding protein [Candidatus Dadabacteria bacterium]
MKKAISLYKSDLEDVRYAECDTGGAPACSPIEIESFSVNYASNCALRNISISLPPCQISAVIGPSGCGKTTLLYSINRLIDLIPEARASGAIKIGATDVYSAKCNLVNLRRRVGMVFQQPVPFPFSIRRNFEIPLKEHGIQDRKQIEERMTQALKDTGLWHEVKDRLNSSAATLSGGQKQRLCIARLLALKPKVLLMDEPCSALDPIASEKIEELVLSLRGRYTIVFVTHNLQQARRIADYAAFFWLKNGTGELIEHGSADAIFSSPQHELTGNYISGRAG